MAKTGYINARVEPELKKNAERVLRRVGVRTSDAVGMFLQQVVLHEGLPFEVRMPNKETRAAMRELDRGGGKKFDSVDALFEDALGKNWRAKVR